PAGNRSSRTAERPASHGTGPEQRPGADPAGAARRGRSGSARVDLTGSARNQGEQQRSAAQLPGGGYPSGGESRFADDQSELSARPAGKGPSHDHLRETGAAIGGVSNFSLGAQGPRLHRRRGPRRAGA